MRPLQRPRRGGAMNMVTTHPRRMLSVGWRVCLAALFAASVEAQPVAYVTNSASGSVSVIDTHTNVVVRTIAVGNRPISPILSADGSRLYITNSESDTVSVIDTAANAVIATIAVGSFPQGLAIAPDGSRAYVGSSFSNFVS